MAVPSSRFTEVLKRDEKTLQKFAILNVLKPELQRTVKVACVFGFNGNEAIVVTADDDVYAFGLNSEGCLGLGNKETSFVPRKIETLCKKKIKRFAFGDGHVLAITHSGEVYSWGNNNKGELGYRSANLVLTPQKIGFNQKIISVACGSHHSMALTDSGKVFVWGLYDRVQNGYTPRWSLYEPVEVMIFNGSKKCIAIACGRTLLIALLNNGEVYSNSTIMGATYVNNVFQPHQVGGLQGRFITQVVCGSDHALALSKDGIVYSWGSNNLGQLGIGSTENRNTAVAVPKDKIGRVVKIAASHHNNISAAMTENLKVYMWGQCWERSVTVPYETPFNSLHDVFAHFAHNRVTWQPMELVLENEIVQTIPPKSVRLHNNLKSLFNDEKTADLKFSVQGKIVHVHKSLVNAGCQHFQSMFQSHWQEDSKDTIEINQYSYNVYHAFLYFLYTDEVKVSPEEAIELLDLANSYFESELVNKCQEIVQSGITVDNAAKLYSMAVSFKLETLEEFCFRFIVNNFKNVTRTSTFEELDNVTSQNLFRKVADLF